MPPPATHPAEVACVQLPSGRQHAPYAALQLPSRLATSKFAAIPPFSVPARVLKSNSPWCSAAVAVPSHVRVAPTNCGDQYASTSPNVGPLCPPPLPV